MITRIHEDGDISLDTFYQAFIINCRGSINFNKSDIPALLECLQKALLTPTRSIPKRSEIWFRTQQDTPTQSMYHVKRQEAIEAGFKYQCYLPVDKDGTEYIFEIRDNAEFVCTVAELGE